MADLMITVPAGITRQTGSLVSAACVRVIGPGLAQLRPSSLLGTVFSWRGVGLTDARNGRKQQY